MLGLEIFGVYLAVAVLFYLGLTVMAVDASVVAQGARRRWQRVRAVKDAALRRFHPLLALRLPKRTR